MGNIAAIDPGRDKSGVAILSEQGEVLFRDIVETKELTNVLSEKIGKFNLSKVVLGNGTTSKKAQDSIIAEFGNIKIEVIDEYNTTQLAKKEYWLINPPRGWRKIIPLELQTPPVPVDDIVAVILGRRYLQKK